MPTRPPTPPTDVKLPPDVTSTRDTLATGAIAYSVRHARLGLLGRLVISALGDQTQVTSEISGDADDPRGLGDSPLPAARGVADSRPRRPSPHRGYTRPRRGRD